MADRFLGDCSVMIFFDRYNSKVFRTLRAQNGQIGECTRYFLQFLYLLESKINLRLVKQKIILETQTYELCSSGVLASSNPNKTV